MNMNKIFMKSSLLVLFVCFSVFSCLSCDNDDDLSAPRIDAVWSNMNTQPIEQVQCAYPRQTVSLSGAGFKGVEKVTVNGYGIDLAENQIYNTDRSIIIVLPQDVATTTATGEAYLKVENAEGEALYQPFYVFTEDEQPVITKFSATTLTPGSQLCITGENLGGATEVYLPLAFDQKVKCELDPAQPSSDTEVYVIVPDGVNFAEGQVDVVMNKVYAPTGAEYVDKAYSEVTNFTN